MMADLNDTDLTMAIKPTLNRSSDQVNNIYIYKPP